MTVRALSAALIVILASCVPGAVSVEAPRSSVAASSAPAATEIATAPATAAAPLIPSLPASSCPRSASTGPSMPAIDPITGVAALPLGPLCGDIALHLRRSGGPGPSTGEVWAIPLDGRPPVLAIRYSLTAGSHLDTNVLRTQLSPDGKRLVLYADTAPVGGRPRWGLVIVDLASGKATLLGRDDNDDDTQPAWSPDGQQIAYVRKLHDTRNGPVDDGVWIMDTGGRTARQLATGLKYATVVFGWSADGTALGVGSDWESLGFVVVDPATGGVIRAASHSDLVSPMGYDAVDWRIGRPAFIGAFRQGGYTPGVFALTTQDTPSAPDRALVRVEHAAVAPGPIPPLPGRPRWRPGSDEALYRLGSELHVIDVRTTKDVAVRTAQTPSMAEWVASGDEVVYLVSAQAPPSGIRTFRIRVAAIDGARDRVLADLQSNLAPADLVVRRYQP